MLPKVHLNDLMHTTPEKYYHNEPHHLIAKSQMNMIKDQQVENVHHDSIAWLTPQQMSKQNNKHIHSYYVIFIIFPFIFLVVSVKFVVSPQPILPWVGTSY